MQLSTARVGAADLAEVAKVAARAFEDDPAFGWFLPDAATRLEKLTGFFNIFTGDQLATDFVDASTTADRAGLCVWLGPEKWEPPTRIGASLKLWRLVGTRSMWRFLVAMATFKKHHPKQPHWYLSTLATEPARQRSGVGRTLLQPGLDRCDEHGLGAYLETQRFENVAYYQRFGFEVVTEVDLGRRGPHMWLMWRNPR